MPLVTEAAWLLGAPVGRTPEAITALLIDQMRDQYAVLDAIAQINMPAQEALAIPRLSCVHKLDYLARCVHPQTLRPVVERYHGRVSNTLLNKLGIKQLLDAVPVYQRDFAAADTPAGK